MKKLLVAVDGSPAALHAARTGLRLADALGGSLTLVFVTPPAYLPPEVPLAVVAAPEDTTKDGERLLERVASQLERLGLQRTVLTGPPAETIADYAESGGFDLVLVGSKGRGAVARVLVGSVTDRLVHICHKPVLVVR